MLMSPLGNFFSPRPEWMDTQRGKPLSRKQL
jgi:hypothetical protein